MTDRKIDTRWHSPPMNQGSTVESITSTFPCAGESTTSVAAGTRGLGSRKKYNVKIEKRSQVISRAGIAIVERIVPIIEAKKINAQITNPAINERKISLKAAFRALPAYFICLPRYDLLHHGQR